jgi:hypothetical protein
MLSQELRHRSMANWTRGRYSASRFGTGGSSVIPSGRTAPRDLRNGAALHRNLHRPPSSRCNNSCVQKRSSFQCRLDISAFGRDLTLQRELSSGGDHRIRTGCQFLKWHIAIYLESLKPHCNFSANRTRLTLVRKLVGLIELEELPPCQGSPIQNRKSSGFSNKPHPAE